MKTPPQRNFALRPNFSKSATWLFFFVLNQFFYLVHIPLTHDLELLADYGRVSDVTIIVSHLWGLI